VYAHKEKHTGTTSETKSQSEGKGFIGFLSFFNQIEEEPFLSPIKKLQF